MMGIAEDMRWSDGLKQSGSSRRESCRLEQQLVEDLISGE